MSRHALLIMCIFGITVLDQCLISAYPDGAPEDTCDNMRPDHINPETSVRIGPQSGRSYFSIQVDKTQVVPNQDVDVTITADEYYFEGFLIQARDVSEPTSDKGSAKKYGTFTMVSNKTQVLCKNQALTHAVHEHFSTITMKWTAPNETITNIHFRATVVKGFNTFFMNVHSTTLNFSDAMACVPSYAAEKVFTTSIISCICC